MATKIGQELVEFSFSQAETKLSDGSLGYDPKNLDNFTKKVEAYERELKRVFGSLVTTVSQIDQVTGQAVSRMYLPKRYEQEALGVRRAVDLQEFGKQGLNSAQAKNLMYQGVADAHFLETTREIKGAKAQQFAKESVIDVGGKIIHTPNTANKDMMTTFIPVSDSTLNAMSKKEIANYVRGVTPESNSASRAEATERARKEHDAQLERDAKRQQAVFNENKRKNIEQQKSEERRKKQEAKEAEKEFKENIMSRKQTLGKIGRIVALLITIADVTRRILTSVLNFGSEYSKSATKANTLNVGAQDLRNLNYLDKALGLEAGTNVQMQEDIRKLFGNTANINTEALKWLTMVMGNEAGGLVRSGIGGDNPAYFAERIIDAFFKRQQEGVDQYGNKVGQDKARRSLVTLLESVSPAIARTFERMVEEQTSGLHAGEITSYRQMQSLYLPSQGSTDALDWERLSKFGKEVDLLKAEFSNLVTLLKVKVADALTGFVTKLDNMHIGKNTEEKVRENQRDYEKLASWRIGYTEQRTTLSEKLNALAKGAGFNSMEEAVSAFADNPKAREFMDSLYESSNWSDVVRYYALGNIIDDIAKEEGKANPNASDLLYGDVGFAKYVKSGLSKHAILQQYYEPWGLTFSPEDYITLEGEDGNAKLNRIATGNLKYSDYTASKRKLIKSGAQSFFNLASKGNKTYYGDIALRAMRRSESLGIRRFGHDDKSRWNRLLSLYNTAMAEGWDSDAGRTLLDLFAFMTGESSLGFLGIGGLNRKQLEAVRDVASSAEDEYGLSSREYRNIDEGRILGMQKFADFKWDRIVATQGGTAGTINVNFEQTLNGEVIERRTIPVHGDMTDTKDITFSTMATVNEANEVVGR